MDVGDHFLFCGQNDLQVMLFQNLNNDKTVEEHAVNYISIAFATSWKYIPAYKS